MKAVLINLLEKDEVMFSALLKRLGLRSRILTSEQCEEHAMASWILEGIDSEEVSEEDVLQVLRDHGAAL